MALTKPAPVPDALFRPRKGSWLVPAGLALGSLCALLFHAVPAAGLLACLAVAGAILLVPRPLRPLGALLLACAWSLWNFQSRLAERLPEARAGEVLSVSGTIRSIPQNYDDYSSFLLQPDPSSEAAVPLPPLILVRWFQDPPRLSAGQRWRLELLVKPPWAPVNFQGPDREKWYFAAGIGALASVRSGVPLGYAGIAAAPLAALRERVFRAVEQAVADPRRRGLLQALAVADRSGLSRSDRRLLNVTGTSHLLAISGLHIGLAAAGGMLAVRALAWLLPLPGAGRLLQTLIIGGGLLAAGTYAALAAFGTSTLRALAMLLVVMLAAQARRPLHPARPWLLALCAVLLIDPFAPLGPGFWFSFLAVAALLVSFVPRPGRRTGLRGWLRTLLQAQAAVMLATLPVGAIWFQSFSAVAYLANLIAIPLVSFLVVPPVLAGVALLGLSDALAAMLWKAAGAAAGLLLRFLERAAEWQGDPVALAPPSVLTAALAVAGGLLLLLPRGLPGRWVGLFLVLPLFLPGERRPPPGALGLDVLDVGQGTAALLRTGTRSLLYDSGPGDGGEANLVASVVVPAVNRAGAGPPDRIVISHGDLDHAGGLQSLQTIFPRSELLANLPPGKAGAPAGLPPCRAPLAWQWDGFEFEVLHPAPGLPYLGNDSSCVLGLRGPGGGVLLAGDVSAAVERRLVTDGLPDYALLLVPHHGSATSSHPAFVDALRPRVAVATAGRGNRFNFPRPEIRRRYERAGSHFWSTGDCGGLRLRLHADGRIEAAAARRSRPGAWRWPAAENCPGRSR